MPLIVVFRPESASAPLPLYALNASRLLHQSAAYLQIHQNFWLSRASNFQSTLRLSIGCSNSFWLLFSHIPIPCSRFSPNNKPPKSRTRYAWATARPTSFPVKSTMMVLWNQSTAIGNRLQMRKVSMCCVRVFLFLADRFQDKDLQTAYFRGRKLRGRRVQLPEGYEGKFISIDICPGHAC